MEGMERSVKQVLEELEKKLLEQKWESSKKENAKKLVRKIKKNVEEETLAEIAKGQVAVKITPEACGIKLDNSRKEMGYTEKVHYIHNIQQQTTEYMLQLVNDLNEISESIKFQYGYYQLTENTFCIYWSF